MLRGRFYIFLIIFLVSIYALTFSSSIFSANTGEGYMRMRALNSFFKSGQLGVNESVEGSIQGNFGLYYGWHEFGQNFFVLPFFLLLKPLRQSAYPFFICNAFITALAAVLIMKILEASGYGRKASLFTALAYGLGSFAWFYAAKAPFEQPEAVFLLLAEFYFAIKYVTNRKRIYLLLSAACLGFGVTTKTELALSSVPLGILLWTGLDAARMKTKMLEFLKIAAVFSVVLAPFAAFCLFYNYIKFGGVFDTGYAKVVRVPFFKPAYLFMGTTGFLFSPGKSIFLYSPALLLSLFSTAMFLRSIPRYIRAGLVSAALVYFLFYSAWADWHGDFCWGPRYLLLITPFLMMPAAALFESWKRLSRAKKTVISSILAASVLVQILPVASSHFLGLVMKYGKYRPIGIGDDGTLSYWASFFRLKESAFFNQFGIFSDTLRMALDKKYALVLLPRLRAEWPLGTFMYFLKWFYLYAGFDLWWAQAGTTGAYLGAAGISVLAALSLYGLIYEFKRAGNPQAS